MSGSKNNRSAGGGRRGRRTRPDDVSESLRRVEESLERLFRAVGEEVKQGFSGEAARAFRSTADGIDRTTRKFEHGRRRRQRRGEGAEYEARNKGWESFERPQLVRSMERKILGGVCGGLAGYWGTEPWVVRLGVVIGALFFFHIVIAAYLIAWIILPSADDVPKRSRSRRPDVSSHDPIAPEFGGRHAFRKSLRTLQRAFREIDRRIRNLEEVVTDPSFNVRREFGKLSD